MAEPLPTDPLAFMHALVAAWNQGQKSGGARTAAAPEATASAPAKDALELAARLVRIEESLLRLEASLLLTREEVLRPGKGRKRRKAKG